MRKITTGIVGGPILGSLVSIENVLQSQNNQNVTITPNGTGITVSSSDIQIDGNNGLKLSDSGSNHVTLKSPSSASASYDLVFPADAGTNTYVLSTDGSGNCSWVESALPINDQAADATTYYPTITTSNSGSISGISVSSTKLTFQPSTGTLTTTDISCTDITVTDITSSGSVSFGSTVRQMLNLYDTSYGIGVQSSTHYYRSGGGFAWYNGGSHNANQNNSGGGTSLLFLSNAGQLYPGGNGTMDLGGSSNRWRNIYTSDLNLNNGIGNYTIVEGEEDLFLYNNKSGKVFKFSLIEVDPSDAPSKQNEEKA